MANYISFRSLGILVCAVVLVVSVWLFVHSDKEDPRNIRYLLWKAGLYRMDADLVISAMMNDSNRVQWVKGRTKDELQHKFGSLLSPEDVSQYKRVGYEGIYQDRDVLFIRNTPWMIVFNDDKATDLVTLKGY